jgi:hypothetical protein
MPLIRINSNPSRNQLGVFAIAWLVFVGGWGVVAWTKAEPTLARALWFLSGSIPLAGLFFPRGLRLVYVALSYATYPIGFVVSHVVLAIIYYLVFTPIGLLMRLLRHDPLSRRFDAKAPSYWKPRPAQKPVSSYFRQN